MIANALDAIEAVAPDFANINLLQGTKYYDSYLSPFKTPAKQSPGGDFYYSEEDLVIGRQRGKSWSWTGVRPTAMCGYAAGNPVNLASVLAVYGSILRELCQLFGFPSTPACFNSLIQVVDAELLARIDPCVNSARLRQQGVQCRQWRHVSLGIYVAGAGRIFRP